VKYHLIGIGGTGMGALAGLLKASGHDVRGSDSAVYPPMSEQLQALNIPVFDGFKAENLAWGPAAVVVGNVCTSDHVEVREAQRLGLPLRSLPATLGEDLLATRRSLVVSGTHGKTTTASLLAHILLTAGRDPSCFIGGVSLDIGTGFRLGAGAEFIVEGDEYDSAFFDKGSKFFHYRPRTAILTSIELAHVDIFSSLAAVRTAFDRFVALIPEDDGLLSCRPTTRRRAPAPTARRSAGSRPTPSCTTTPPAATTPARSRSTAPLRSARPRRPPRPPPGK
jgi:UDP-N-acetylmuramate: L-alanyl-gamma-D-glutamyl-meso-diaminopimelate ligase